MAPSRVRRVAAVLGLALLASLIGLSFCAPPAKALPGYAHGPAQECASCHHDNSYRQCSECHTDVSVPNQACVKCHPGKTTAAKTCWNACHTPGAPQPAYSNENCITDSCHGSRPHVGASPNCTGCHPATPATPHHDGKTYQAPTCNTCHPSVQKHDGQECTACHSPDVHPDIPVVPEVCNRCHSAAVFNGVGNCLECHSGQKPYAGKTDNDIHSANIPDAPISAQSCRSCHPQAQKHAGSVGCLTCHTQADAFHHGTESSPGFPACTTCHQNMKQHGPGLSCTTCHAGAQHLTSPPTPAATFCNTCHPSSEFGRGGCYRCHSTPIYHVTPSVGPCSSCHGGGREEHAGKVSCRTCHTNIRSGHHLGGVVIPTCTQAGCHAQQSHVGTVGCSGCHGSGAAHDATPRNLPSDTWSVCGQCHTFVTRTVVAAVGACSTCHDTTHHSASYRVGSCVSCHADKLPHAGSVACRLCHVNLAGGHHTVGNVGARQCSACHVNAQIHASGLPAGASFGCTTCHDGSIHGEFTRPGREVCAACHSGAEEHASGYGCIECHWTAAHSQMPNAAQYSRVEKMPVTLPVETTTTSTTGPGGGTPPQQPGLGNTGIGFGALGLLTLSLLSLGIAVRKGGLRSPPR